MNANRMKSLRNLQRCSNDEFLLEQLKIYQGGENFTQKRLRGLTTWKDMLENALREIASWQTKKVKQLYTLFQVLAWMITNFKEETESVGKLSKVCSQIVLKCLFLARTGRPDILWSVKHLQEQSQNGPTLATDVLFV